MILTWSLPATQPTELLDSLNLESGNIYNRVLVRHWRYYNKHKVWLRQSNAEKIDDKFSNQQSILHSHSIDAAQQAFYKAIKTARELRKTNEKARFPWKRKRYRTTVFKSTQIKLVEGSRVRLSMANRRYLYIKLAKPLQDKPELNCKEARLVYNRQAHRYDWHVVIEDSMIAPILEAKKVMAGDLGEVHPVACATHTEGIIISCRELRSISQHRNKCLAQLSSLMAKCNKGSRRWHTLRRAKVKRRAYFEHKIRDLEHKISRLLINQAVGLDVSVIVLGDVRNIGVGKKLTTKSQQKISQWSHGRIRKYIEYKGARVGISVLLESEEYTTQTCPQCQHRKKPKGRMYQCKNCGFVGHRDVVGASNILAKFENGQLGGIYPKNIVYKHPYDCRKQQKVSGESTSSGPSERVHVAGEQLSFF